jgi:hypothetical protein
MKNEVIFFVMMLCLNCNAFNGFSQTKNVVNYTESFEIIANPERGLQKYSITSNNYNTDLNYSNISESNLMGWRTGPDKVTVIYRYFMLSAFMNSDISQTYIDNIQIDFSRIRNAGLKCIVRFAYTHGISSSPQQPVKTQILAHIHQLAHVLDSNQDIILSHQAGFIGTWGEWYYTNSAEFGTEGNISSAQWQNRKEIIEAMLNATPLGIPVQVRYPKIKKTMYGSSQLNETTAYQNTPNARIGFYNDAFLNNWGDMGTYGVGSENQNPVGTADYNYLSNETKYTIMTGETNGINAPRTNGANAVYEMGLTNWTTLNRDYFTQNWTNWIDSGHYNEILRRLGYRFVLRNSEFVMNDKNLTIEINLENVGFARIPKYRDVYLVLKNTSTGSIHSFSIDTTDIRTWETSVHINQVFDLSGLSQGSYNCYLNIPDTAMKLKARPEYSIRFANDNLWENTSGFNQLNQIVDTRKVTSDKVWVWQPEDISVYPNPAYGHLYIKSYTVSGPATVSTSNILGEIVDKKNVEGHGESGSEILLDISDFNNGIYFLTIRQSHRIWTTKFIKRTDTRMEQ